MTFQSVRDKNRGVLVIDDDAVNQTLTSPSFSLQNSLSTLIPLNEKQFVNLKSLINYTHDTQNYQIDPTEKLTLDQSVFKPYIALDQSLRDNSFYTKNEASISWQLKALLVTAEGGMELTDRKYSSQLYGLDASQSHYLVSPDYANDLRYFSAISKAGLKLNYKQKRFSANVHLPLKNYHIDLQDRALSRIEKLDKAVFEPNVFAQYDWSTFWALTLSGSQQYRFASLEQLYPNFVMSQLNFSSYNSDIWKSRYRQAATRIAYKSPINNVFGDLVYVVSEDVRTVMFTQRIAENGQQIVDVIARDNAVNGQSVSAAIGKFFANWRGNASIRADLSVSNSELVVNEQLLAVKTKSHAVNFKANSNYWSWLDVSYQLDYQNQYRTEGRTPVRSINVGHQFGADVFPMVHHSVGVILDYNEYQLSEQRFVNRFLDLKYRFNWVSKRMDFGLQWNNILNTKTHEQVFVQEALTSVTTFALRPSQVLASVRFTFGN